MQQLWHSLRFLPSQGVRASPSPTAPSLRLSELRLKGSKERKDNHHETLLTMWRTDHNAMGRRAVPSMQTHTKCTNSILHRGRTQTRHTNRLLPTNKLLQASSTELTPMTFDHCFRFGYQSFATKKIRKNSFLSIVRPIGQLGSHMAIAQMLMLEAVTFYIASIGTSERWVRQQVWDKGIQSITGRALIDDDNRRSLYHQIQFFASNKQIKEHKLVEQVDNNNQIKESEWDSPLEIADFRLRPITYRSPDGLVLGERPRRLLQLIWGAEDILDGIDWYRQAPLRETPQSNEEVYKPAKSPRKI